MPIEKVFPGESNVVLKDIFSGQRMEIGPDVGGRVAVALEPRGFKVFVMDKK
jgi:hypothetical protein